VLVPLRQLNVSCNNTHKPRARCQVVLLPERPEQILGLELIRHADTGIFDLMDVVSKNIFHLNGRSTHYKLDKCSLRLVKLPL